MIFSSSSRMAPASIPTSVVNVNVLNPTAFVVEFPLINVARATSTAVGVGLSPHWLRILLGNRLKKKFFDTSVRKKLEKWLREPPEHPRTFCTHCQTTTPQTSDTPPFREHVRDNSVSVDHPFSLLMLTHYPQNQLFLQVSGGKRRKYRTADKA